jgi:two-component system cell cycle response regulator CtrA
MARPRRIWVLDDDPELRSMLEGYLTEQGYAVRALADGEQLRARLEGHLGGERPDLLVLDLMLPGSDGLSLLRRLRDDGDDLPVLLLSARADGVDRIIGLEQGADDYLAKPFDQQELVARLQAIIRRSKGFSHSRLEVGGITMDLSARDVSVDGTPVPLTSKEYAILELLVLRRGAVLNKENFLDHLYGGIDEPDSKIIDVFICKLRKKLTHAGADNFIGTVWGRGYIVRDQQMQRSTTPAAAGGQALAAGQMA